MFLEQIKGPNDIKKIKPKDYSKLALEIRRFLVHKVSNTGGHLASNLGTVELTMALHLALDLPKDKIIWDVGHQSYTHKLLTGRMNEFDSLRSFGGLSGFPKMSESPCDVFDTGHSSTSISAGLGIVMGQQIKGEDGTVVCVIGDGALTGGMAFEALNNAAMVNRNFIIILNDNKMSISENVGSMSSYLDSLRLGEGYNDLKAGVQKTLHRVPVIGDTLVDKIVKTKSSIKQLFIPGMLFEDMGITYVGPFDGHDVKKLVNIIGEAKKIDHPVLIHVLTKKGRGYRYAESNPSKFHGIAPFVVKTGELKTKKKGLTYTDVFANTLSNLAYEDKKIMAITAAMPDGTGLSRFKKKFPDRCLDVGIAEEHAVTFAAGMATTGLKPFFAVYSSFLQRSYDQIIHDVCIPKLPVKFMVDRAGLVGKDGETHQGIFDISYLLSVPNMTVIAPINAKELEMAVKYSASFEAPIAVRYSRGYACDFYSDEITEFEYGKSICLKKGEKIAIINVGNMIEESKKCVDKLIEDGYNPELINARFIKPLDKDMIKDVVNRFDYVITVEEGIISGGYGESILKYINDLKNEGLTNIPKVLNIGIEDKFVKQGDINTLRKVLKIDGESIYERIKKIL